MNQRVNTIHEDGSPWFVTSVRDLDVDIAENLQSPFCVILGISLVLSVKTHERMPIASAILKRSLHAI